MAGAIAVAALALGIASVAAAQGNGGMSGSPIGKADPIGPGSLTYDTFTASSCSQAAFATLALGHLTLVGPTRFDGVGYLDGVKHSTYSGDLKSGPATFDTDFSRDFITLFPPAPPSSTYTYVFFSSVYQGETFFGNSVTTIVCTAGTFSASNVWTAAPSPIPATGHSGLVALAALLAFAGAARLRRAHRARA